MRNYKEEAKRLKKELGKHGGLSFFRAIGYVVETVRGGWVLKKKETCYDGRTKIKPNIITSKRLSSKLEMFEYILKDGFDTTSIYDKIQPTDLCLVPQEWDYKSAGLYKIDEVKINLNI